MFSEVLGSLHCVSPTVDTLTRPPTLHFFMSAGCLLCLDISPSVRLRPLPDISLRPVAAGALTVALTAAASLREF